MKQLSHFREYGLRPFCDQLNLRFIEVFYGYDPGTWKSSLPHNRLICILESDGESFFQDADETIPLTADTAVLVPAFHEITHHQNDSMHLLSIHFALELYCGVDILTQRKHLWQERNPERTLRIRRMTEHPERLLLTATLRTLCWDAILRSLDSAPELENHNLLPSYTRYEALFEFLLHNCHAGIDVGQMADVLRMNKETFIKNFIRDTGIPPKQFFNRLLVDRASRLLSGTDRTIRETALELEFCNEFYFSRFFRNHLGISPREYRKRYQMNPEKSLLPDSLL